MRITPDQVYRLSTLAVKRGLSFVDICAIAIETGLQMIEEDEGIAIEQSRKMQLSIKRGEDFQAVGTTDD